MQIVSFFHSYMLLSIPKMMTIGYGFSKLFLTIIQSQALHWSLIDKALILLSNHQKGLLKDIDHVFNGYSYGYCL